jgi:hypothetical protein
MLAWCLTLREEHRLKVFANRALRRIFGPKRDEVSRYSGKLYSEERQNLYFSPHIMIDFKMGRKCSTNGEANYLKNVDWKA